MPRKMSKYSFKLLLLGQGEVGKTSLIKRYVDDFFEEGYQITLGVDFLSKNIKLTNSKDKLYDVTFQIWDVAGQSGFTNFRHLYLKKAHGVFLVFDMKRPDTLDKLESWKTDVNKHSPEAVTFLIGNKEDLAESNPWSEKDAERFNAVQFFTTSAKTGHRVEEAFDTMGRKILESVLK